MSVDDKINDLALIGAASEAYHTIVAQLGAIELVAQGRGDWSSARDASHRMRIVLNDFDAMCERQNITGTSRVGT